MQVCVNDLVLVWAHSHYRKYIRTYIRMYMCLQYSCFRVSSPDCLLLHCIYVIVQLQYLCTYRRQDSMTRANREFAWDSAILYIHCKFQVNVYVRKV